jgi:hypothetical protein
MSRYVYRVAHATGRGREGRFATGPGVPQAGRIRWGTTNRAPVAWLLARLDCVRLARRNNP